MSVNGSGQIEHSSQRICHRCFPPSFGSFGQTVSEKKNFKNQPIRNKNRLWRPCLLTDQDKMSKIYRGPSIDVSYQVSVHLAKRFQRRRFLKICIKINAFWIQISIFKQEYLSFHRRYFRNQPIWNKNCLWQPCLLTNRDKMNTLYRGPSIDASYQVSVHLDKRFQRRRFLEICLSETRIACGGHVC